MTDQDGEPAILLRAEEVAALLGLGRTKVFEMLAASELPTVRIGRCVRVPRADLDEWVRSVTMRRGTDNVRESNGRS
jgi:excisionase family DNA binding protein